MRVVVTGAAGFLGSHLCEALVERGDEVVGFDNLVTGRRENLDGLAGHPRFVLVEHDVTVPYDVDGGVDGVLHLASPASPVDFDRMPVEILEVSGAGTRNGLDLAERKGARFVMASTSEVYGDPEVHPQPEGYWGNVNPIGPRSCYDEGKRYAEALTVAYHRSRGVDAGIVRTFNTAGPRMRPDDGRLLCTLVGQALGGEPLTVHGDGTQTRSLCWVGDQVAGYVAMLDRTGVLGPVNVGSPEELTVNEIAALVLDVTGSASPVHHVPARPEDPARRRPDVRLAAEALGWRPTVPAAETVRRTADWYRKGQA